jgi:16S rRNA (cytidine1402-2'-O)-methyltransferase
MSKLYIVPTPIGNLKDITLRAIEVLKEVDVILAEDTRKTGYLLNHYAIKTGMLSHHKFNEHKRKEMIISRLLDGETMALVTDAGTPGISDPGFLLIRECIINNIDIESLPGATSFVPALINSGLPSDRFVFEGFLPHKKGRQKKLKELASSPYTMIFFESPHRLIKTIEQFIEYFGTERKASISRELTKIFEETQRGTLAELKDYYKEKKIKGEIVIIVEASQ